MMTPLFAAILILAPQAKDSATFTDAYLGLSFTHPKNWIELKRTKDIARYTIPVEGTTDTAELEIIRSNFHSTKDVWQTIQLRANETLHREIVRQWEQDVIKVPMLCTQINFTDHDIAKTTLTGLYYTKTPLKMLVRLTSPVGDFDKVKYQFDQALLSLHTSNGTTPVEDDADFKFATTKKPALAPPMPEIIDAGTPTVKKAPKTPKKQVTIPLTVSTKSVSLHAPQGWTFDTPKDGVTVLHHSGLLSGLTVEIHSTLDSDRPSRMLTKITGAELPEFLAGVKREDTDPTHNDSGCSIGTVWRIGKDAKGDLFVYHASGEQGDFYFIASYRSTSLSKWKSERRVIDALMEQISLTGSE